MGRVPVEHRKEAAALTALLHSQGWARHVTVERLLQDWEQLAAEVSAYPMTIDDYTNDLTARDALEIVTQSATPHFAGFLNERIGSADERFKESTGEDGGVAVGRYFRIGDRPAWWWRRRPTSGQLSDYLDRP